MSRLGRPGVAPAAGLRIERAGQTLAERRAFAELATPFLALHEAQNNLQLSVLDQVATGSYADTDVELLRAVAPGEAGGGSEEASRTRSVLICTPPYSLLVCRGDSRPAREALLADLLARGVALPGVTGGVPEVHEAAGWWASHAGKRAELEMRLGVYQLTAVTDKPRAPGVLRPAGESDRELALGWFDGFNAATNNALPRGPAETWRLFNSGDSRRLYLWEVDGRPVSLAGLGGRTPNGRRVGPVYTPPEERRKGYAEALVAALCRDTLAAGAQFCFLYTDLDFPTSNHVYRDVGFRQIGEAAELKFTAG